MVGNTWMLLCLVCNGYFCVQGFTRFVEVGRVALINYGPDCGKLCTIIDIVDAKRVCSFWNMVVKLYVYQVLVEGPSSITGVQRQIITCKRISLTDIVVKKIGRNARESTVAAAWKVT